MVSRPSYEDALSTVRDMLATNVAFPGRLPGAAELQESVRLATRAAIHDGIPLVVVAADFGRIVAETMFGDPTAVELARAMARAAAREFQAPSVQRDSSA